MSDHPDTFSQQQLQVIHTPEDRKIFLEGQAGSGKTSASVERLNSMLRSGIPASSILVLTPQRSLAQPYRQVAEAVDLPAGGEVSVLTLGGLAQRMISLFWPMVAQNAGFKQPARSPQFLTLETAQYYLARLLTPLLQKGFFESITIDPNRIFSQVLDNLNKAAVVGFSIDEIAPRLKSAWSGVAKQAIVYDQVQECARLFRDYCLNHNLLDFSLQFEIFAKNLWPSALCRNYLQQTYKHLFYDNIEEDVPAVHDIIASWLPDFDSALLIMDTGGGFRTFLGADITSAQTLKTGCQEVIRFTNSYIQSKPVQEFESHLTRAIVEHQSAKMVDPDVQSAFSVHPFRFYPQAMDWIVSELDTLTHKKGVPLGQIVVLTPFLSDSLRFSLTQRLSERGLPFSTFRPSRSLREEPSVSAMLTLAKLAHPHWGLKLTRHELRYTLMQIIPEADLIRADLLSQILYSPNREGTKLGSFNQIRSEMQQRITFTTGLKAEKLRDWLEEASSDSQEELDIFFSRLFGELLSQADFSFHQNYEAASLISRLIESSRKFRQVISTDDLPPETSIGKEYLQMVEQGVISAQYLTNWEDQRDLNSILISPAFTYLMSNRPVEFQFWLDVGSTGWWTRLDQPLTQPYVLSRNWNKQEQWTNANENAANQATLLRVTSGLLHRCSTHVNLISVGLNESGNEERGALLVAIQSVLRGLSEGAHV